MAEYTKEEKQEYFKNLREEWKLNKQLADDDTSAKMRFDAIMREAEGKVSWYSFYWTYKQMEKLGLTGNPYVDCKTYEGWKKAGFKVIKGEKSKINGITWLSFSGRNPKTSKKEDVVYPKLYHLFHSSQVEPIK